MLGLKIFLESKLFGRRCPCVRSTSATLYLSKCIRSHWHTEVEGEVWSLLASYKRWSRVLVPPLELAVACLAPHGSAWLRPNGWVWGHVQRAELGARDARERCQGTQGHQGHWRETREKRVSSTHQTTETKEVSNIVRQSIIGKVCRCCRHIWVNFYCCPSVWSVNLFLLDLYKKHLANKWFEIKSLKLI